MKLNFLLALMFHSFCCSAQEYRLRYDAQDIPELYHETSVFLEKKEGDNFKRVTAPYQLISNDMTVLPNHKIRYNPEIIRQNGGSIPVEVVLGSAKLRLPLALPLMKAVRFNLYTDSIKPVLDYYVNAEGMYSSGRIFPLTTKQVAVSSSTGKMEEMVWKIPKKLDVDSVQFTVTSLENPELSDSVTVFIKRYKDPRDAY